MADYRLSRLARRDLDKIWEHIANDNPVAADLFLDELHDSCLLLSKNKLIGSERSKLAPNLRMLPHKSYLIFYVPTSFGVEIVRVLHSARDIDQIFESETPN